MSSERLELRVELSVPGRLSVDFTCPPGSVVAVIGPNGAGKSTLLQAIAGLIPADGSLRLGDRDLTGLPTRDRGIGMVFQDRFLFPHLRAVDNVAFGPRMRGLSVDAAHERAREWLDRLGVGDLAGRRPGELSGGQAQRVAIARALATEPQLLLLDEPMAGLDVRVATALRLELARHLRDYPGISLMVTHDAIDALTVADTVLVIDGGEQVQFGAPADVAARPRTDHVARLVGLNVVRQGDDLVAFAPELVAVDVHQPDGSPRLRWHGRVGDVAPHGTAVRVLVHTDSLAGAPGGSPGSRPAPDLLADVTAESAAELSLVPGREVWLSVKSTAVRRYRAVEDDQADSP